MATILNIETTTTNCSVALSVAGKTIALRENNHSNYSHDTLLHLYIEEALKQAKLSVQQLDAVAVSMGPGSYTGLRIGVSAAKGLCFALNKPLIAVSTLEALSHKINPPRGVIIPLLDARRMEVYAAVFDTTHTQIREIKAEIIDKHSFERYLSQDNVYFVGNAVPKTKDIISHHNAIFVEDKLPSANEMSALSQSKFEAMLFEDIAYFEPFYLKNFVSNSKKV